MSVAKWFSRALEATGKKRLEPSALVPSRRRLRVELGAAVLGAATVVAALSLSLRPTFDVEVSSPRSSITLGAIADTDLAPKGSGGTSDFLQAVARADVEEMEHLYFPGMSLTGTLHDAAMTGSKPTVQWLLDHGADVHDAEDTEEAPLLAADDHPDVVALLRERGAAEPTLLAAAEACAPNAVARLLAAHVAVEGSAGSPLEAALRSMQGTPEKKELIVESLLRAGAAANGVDEEQASPLGAAVYSCAFGEGGSTACVRLVRILIRHGAHAKADALIAALGLADPERMPVLEAVLKAPADRGATATALAQTWNVPQALIARIVSKGIEWAWHDGEDDAARPLFAAIYRGDREMVKSLLDAGAPADVRYKDATSPLLAALDGTSNNGGTEGPRIVELLLERGVDVNRRLPDGRTPLYAAAENGDLRILQALLDHGARVNDLVLDDTALDAAEQNEHVPAARVLHARGGRRARKPADTHSVGE